MEEDEKLIPLAELALPWGKQLLVSGLEYQSGLKMVRLRFREGKHRFTIVDVDADNIAKLAELFTRWSAELTAPADGENDGE